MGTPSMRSRSLLLICLAGALAGAGPGPSAPPAALAAPAPTSVLAVEDTMHTEVPEVLVKAPRVTLAEILDRVAAGEARRDSLVNDQSYLLTVRMVGHANDGKTPKLIEETVSRVYQRRPKQTRRIELRHWKAKPPKKSEPRADVNVEVDGDMSEDIANFAFQPSGRRNFKFRIAGREFLGDHVVYRLAFEPRSALDVYEPSGEVWVDTRDYVIIRQEISFRQSPVPMFLRGIDRMVVERQQVGGHWVLGRVLARIRLTIPFPQYGTSIDFAIQFTDYTLNTGLADSLFNSPASKKVSVQ